MKELERLATGEAIIELEETPSMCPSDESAISCEVIAIHSNENA